MVPHASNLNTQETEARGSQVPDLFGGLHSKNLSFKKRKKEKEKRVIDNAEATTLVSNFSHSLASFLDSLDSSWTVSSESGP